MATVPYKQTVVFTFANAADFLRGQQQLNNRLENSSWSRVDDAKRLTITITVQGTTEV